jgi:hypothetical protein
MAVRRELCFSNSGIVSDTNTPTGEILIRRKESSRRGPYSRERTEGRVEGNQDSSLVEKEEPNYAADEQMIKEVDVGTLIVDEEGLGVEEEVRVEVGEEYNDLVCDEMEENDDVNELSYLVPSRGDAGHRYSQESNSKNIVP